MCNITTVESRFLKPPDFLNQFSFPLDILFSNFTPDFSSLPISQTNFCFPWRFKKTGFYSIICVGDGDDVDNGDGDDDDDYDDDDQMVMMMMTMMMKEMLTLVLMVVVMVVQGWKFNFLSTYYWRVVLKSATKTLQFVLAQDVLALTWASG